MLTIIDLPPTTLSNTPHKTNPIHSQPSSYVSIPPLAALSKIPLCSKHPQDCGRQPLGTQPMEADGEHRTQQKKVHGGLVNLLSLKRSHSFCRSFITNREQHFSDAWERLC